MTVLSMLVILSLLLLWLYFDKFVKLSLAFVINWSFKRLKMARNAARVQEKPHKWAFLSLFQCLTGLAAEEEQNFWLIAAWKESWSWRSERQSGGRPPPSGRRDAADAERVASRPTRCQ